MVTIVIIKIDFYFYLKFVLVVVDVVVGSDNVVVPIVNIITIVGVVVVGVFTDVIHVVSCETQFLLFFFFGKYNSFNKFVSTQIQHNTYKAFAITCVCMCLYLICKQY